MSNNTKTPITYIVRLNTNDGIDVYPECLVQQHLDLIPPANRDAYRVFAAAAKAKIRQALSDVMKMSYQECVELIADQFQKDKEEEQRILEELNSKPEEKKEGGTDVL